MDLGGGAPWGGAFGAQQPHTAVMFLRHSSSLLTCKDLYTSKVGLWPELSLKVLICGYTSEVGGGFVDQYCSSPMLLCHLKTNCGVEQTNRPIML